MPFPKYRVPTNSGFREKVGILKIAVPIGKMSGFYCFTDRFREKVGISRIAVKFFSRETQIKSQIFGNCLSSDQKMTRFLLTGLPKQEASTLPTIFRMKYSQ